MKFNELKTRKDLATILGIPLSKLTYVLYKKSIEDYYISFDIPKKNGGVRIINAPTGDLKEIQKSLSDRLWSYQKVINDNENIRSNISHGFEKGKSIITNSKIHKNRRYVLNIDIEDFFGSFHFGRVRGYFEKNHHYELSREIATIIAQLTCFEGKLPQGAPSSPIITNLICNILDMRLMKIAKKYKLNYTRYADDLTFSTNDKYFLDNYPTILNGISKEIEMFGLNVNDKKTRLVYKDKRQEVTGLVVNKKPSIKKEFYKSTRAMADSLYINNEFFISDLNGTINQLEGRFSFIDQLDHYNNKLDKHRNSNNVEKIKHDCWHLNSREKQYQKFLFYKYFFANNKPLLVTEGKTDIIYIKSALKKYYMNYPKLIEKKGNNFEYKISFLRKSKRIEYFFRIFFDGADSMKNIYNLYRGNGFKTKFYNYFEEKSKTKPIKPVILIFDNEQKTDRPLKGFINHSKLKNKNPFSANLSENVIGNLYLLTNPLVKGMQECEIEDLFSDDVLGIEIDGRTFSRKSDSDDKKVYGKVTFSNYVYKNYDGIDFVEFMPMLDELNDVIEKHSKQI